MVAHYKACHTSSPPLFPLAKSAADAGTTGYVGGLKYAFTGQAYARLLAAYANPGTATDSQVAPYADHYFEYDGFRRVTKSVVPGDGDSTATLPGLGTYTYAYTPSGFSIGYNRWATKNVETLPDGNTETVYSNLYGEIMLAVFKETSSGLTWETFDQYDGVGRVAVSAAPSAVSGYDDSKADLLNNISGNYQYLRDGSGLVTTTTYASANGGGIGETTGGDAANYRQAIYVKQGETGTAVALEAWQYFQHAGGSSQTIYPLAGDTLYRNTDGTGAQVTTLAYTWNNLRPQSIVTTLPTVTTGQNGPGAADVSTTVFDAWGRPVWAKDADGFLSYLAYDAGTGAVVTAIDDVNTANTGDFTGLPSGWSTPSGGGLHLITRDVVDGLGRATQETSPVGNVAYRVYNDAAHEVLTYPGWDAGSGVPTGPTQGVRQDWANGYVEAFTMTATPHLTGGLPDGSEAIAGLQTLARDYYNTADQVTTTDAYFNLGGLTYTTAVLGTLGTNYYQTTATYDGRGRRNRVQAATGTIYRTAYDSLGRPSSASTGTNDSPTSNMVQVAGYQYDGGGVGDGLLTQTTAFTGDGTPDRVSQFWYDWRDRLVASKDGVQTTEDTTTHRPIVFTTYDNLDEATQTDVYDGDGVSVTTSGGVPVAPSATLLRGRATASFDEQGRAYETKVFDVNPSTGAVSSSALTTESYFDHRGNLLAASAPGGLWSKLQYDGAGRATFAYTTDGASGTTWANAGSVSGDNVLEQAQTVFDANSNVIETISKQRFHDETTTGALGDAATTPKARVSYAAAYYDKADRVTADVAVGTNAGSAWTRPSSVPSASDTALVTQLAYNSAGWVQDVTDPRGIVTRTTYDNAGRATKTVEDYTDGTVTASSNKTIETTYDGDNNVLTVQADLPGGAYQKTQYVYTAPTEPGLGLYSNDLLRRVNYPDATTGDPTGGSDLMNHNYQSEAVDHSDRNGTTHTYTRDVLGRVTSDAITALGSGVDGAVRRLGFEYDTQGNLFRITSYDAATGGNIVNQIQRAFNGLGQMTTEYQSHSGAVNTGTTPNVQYAYTDLSSGNHSRLTSMTYPNGKALNFNYATGLDSNISRLTSLSDSTGTLESYKYLGLDTVVERAHPQINVNLTYISQTGLTGDAGDKYTGLDRFGRVVDQNWYNTTTSLSTDRFQLGYDRNSEVLYKNNLVNAVFSELYHASGAANGYDLLGQIAAFARGALLDTNADGVPDTVVLPTHSQNFTPDAVGNFSSITTDSTTQTRTHNKQNEIATISGQSNPTYDANGNLTADGAGNTFVYDAWNRLVAVKQGTTTIASYAFDALGRRIQETNSGTTKDVYFSTEGQVLEERVSGAVKAQYIWSPVYVNALILRDRDSTGGGTLNERLWAQQDANWNVTALLDNSGNVVERFVYDPYGLVTVLTPTWGSRSSSSYAWVYTWQGGRSDPATGLLLFGERDYSPALLRWLQRDPIEFGGGDVNVYRAEGGNPINEVDPSGLLTASQRELAKRLPAWFLRLDTEGAGQVGLYQWKEVYGAGGFRKYDRNGDGFITYEEMARWPANEPEPARPDDGKAAREVPAQVEMAPPVQPAPVLPPEPLPPTEAGPNPTEDIERAIRDVEDYHKKFVAAAEAFEQTAPVIVFGLELGASGFRGLAQELVAPGAGCLRPPKFNQWCFPPDTLIATAAGLRPIQQVEAGQLVWSYDFHSGAWRLCRVECRHDADYDGPLVMIYADVGNVTATAYHPFWVIQGDDLANHPSPRHVEPTEDRGGSLPGQWVNSHDLREGDVVFLRDRESMTIRRVMQRHERTHVCNLTVQGLHTFAVGEMQVLVHNTSGSRVSTEWAIRRWRQDQERINRIAQLMRDEGYEAKDIARWIREAKDRALGRLTGRSPSGSLPPWPAPWSEDYPR